jgi:hypothetical protein
MLTWLLELEMPHYSVNFFCSEGEAPALVNVVNKVPQKRQSSFESIFPSGIKVHQVDHTKTNNIYSITLQVECPPQNVLTVENVLKSFMSVSKFTITEESETNHSWTLPSMDEIA